MFAEYAPLYWAKGMPVIPLRPNMKVPAINAWNKFANQMPSEQEQATWLEYYSDGNIGLPLGPQSGVIGLDLDSEDPEVLKILERVMPPTPWKRVGKKGAVFAFKCNGERTFRIRDEDNNSILELLCAGTQIVLPPSIHPQTLRPYEATGFLPDMVDQLPTLPLDFETQVRDALIAKGFKLTGRGRAKVSEWVPAGGRDSAMTAIAGIMARGVLRGERSLVEALHEIEVKCLAYCERVAGDEIDPEKFKRMVMSFIQRDLASGRHTLPPLWSKGMTDEEITRAKALFGEDMEEWTVDKYLSELDNELSGLDPTDSAGRTMVVEALLRRAAKSNVLTVLDHDVIIRYISQATGKLTTTGGLHRRLRELQKSDMPGVNHAEIAGYVHKELSREGEVRFHQTRFYRWGGSHWTHLPDYEVQGVIAKEFGDLPAAKRRSDHRGIAEVMAQLASQPLRTEHKVHGINFANGFLTSDLEMLPHSPDLGCTYVLPYRYVEDDRAPTMWLSLLDQCWSHEPDYLDRVQALREAIAATLFGVSWRYARAFCLFGIAHSGKSTILNIIRGLIPTEASSSVSPDDWGDRFLPTMMEGKLINFCGELSESAMINGASFKRIVEGAEIPGQFKGRDIFHFNPTCAQWFAGNFVPRSRDSSDGFARRWLFFTFNKKVPLSQKRVGLEEEILAEEREAIVAWAVPAIRDLERRNDFTLPACHLETETLVANQNNSVRQFLVSGQLGVRADSSVDEVSLYLAYHMFCKVTAKCEPVSRVRFRALMASLATYFQFRVVVDKRDASTELAHYDGLELRKPAKVA